MMRTLFAFMVALALTPGLSVASERTTKPVPQSSVTTIDNLQRGSMVTVKGTVERILDTDEFRLADQTGDVVVYVGWKNFVPVNVGEAVTVRGFVDDGLILEIYAREITHQDGRITRLEHSG